MSCGVEPRVAPQQPPAVRRGAARAASVRAERFVSENHKMTTAKVQIWCWLVCYKSLANFCPTCFWERVPAIKHAGRLHEATKTTLNATLTSPEVRPPENTAEGLRDTFLEVYNFC